MQTYRFDEFELDLHAQQLRLRGRPVRLERRPFDLLALLVSRHHHMVSRDDIIAALWPANTIIDFDSGLNTLVRKVRGALGDSSEQPRFIETVPGRGYRFIAPIEPATRPSDVVEQAVAIRPNRASRRIAVLLLLLLGFGGAMVAWQTSIKAPEQTRIAVLSFENLTGKEELAYLASGIAEDTSTSLAQIDLPNLSVIGAVSAGSFANSTKTLPQIGHELDVDFVITSSLRQEESRIRVTSRLIRVADGQQVWSASFDRELTNVLGLQRELSIAIAEQIRQRLSPEVAAALDRRQTQSPEAYEQYLKGRYEWTRFQPDSVARSLEYYRQAVAIDPGYALAWAGMANALITSTVTIEADRESILPASRDALQRALEFGPDLAETQHALGSFYFFLDRDLPSAEAAGRQALALDPNIAMTHMFMGLVLSQRDKHVEARAMLRRARELDPLFPLIFANSAMVALAANEPRESLELATQAIAINPEFWVGHLHLGTAHLALGDYEAALQAYSAAYRFAGNNSARAASSRAYVLSKLGRKDEARDVLAVLVSESAGRFVSPYYIAVVYAGLEEVDSAFEALERARSTGDLWCPFLENDRMLDTLRTDLRFETLIDNC